MAIEVQPAEAVRFVERFPGPYPGGEGRGVVLPAGGHYLVGAWMVIDLLRNLGCTLPVEIWHQGPSELNRVSDLIDQRFSGVAIRDIGRAGGERDRGGWQLKAEALERSAFQEVLLLDADNHPLHGPDCLFDDEGFVADGTLFWQAPMDNLEASNDAWRRFGLEPRALPGLDSGQMLVDRLRAWPAVALASFVNRHSDVYWRGLHGDKDTFLLSWLRARVGFSVIPERGMLSGNSIYQADRNGHAFFRHRFGEKWSTKEPPPAASRDPASNLMRELRSRLGA